MKLADLYAEYICQTKIQNIPKDVLEEKKKNILDTLGVMVAGSKSKGCKSVVEEIIQWGGRNDAKIVQYGVKVPIHNAALANCMMARALDFDDVFTDSIVHINASNVPVSFVVADYIGGISGKEILESTTIGADVAARMALANKIPSNISGFSFSFQFGSIIAAIVSSKLLKLDEKQTKNALGIAYSQLAGNNQCYVDGAMTIRLQQGLSAAAGVMASIFAKNGVTGAHDIFDGRFGYFNVFAGGNYDRDLLKKDLGREFYGAKHTIKPYPCCTHLHGAIDAILSMRGELKGLLNEIEEINIGVNQSAYNICCIPEDEKQYPKKLVDLQFSYNFVVAAALIEGQIGIDSFSEIYLHRNEILEFGKNKVKTYVNSKGALDNRSVTDTEVTVKLKNGLKLEKYIAYPFGSKQNPMDLAMCTEKFKKCLEKGIIQYSDDKKNEIVETLLKLEHLDNVSNIYQYF